MKPEIKQKTVYKCLAVLKDMKHRVDLNYPMNASEIVRGHKTNHAIPVCAKLLGYFEVEFPNKWICKKTRFDPIDARRLLEFMYDRYKSKPKEKANTKDGDESLLYSDNIDKVRKIQVRFIPPTLQEVENYCIKRGNHIDPEELISYYEKRDWKRNGEKIKSWKSCVITWERNQKDKLVFITKGLKEYSDDEMEKEFIRRGYKGKLQKDILF